MWFAVVLTLLAISDHAHSRSPHSVLVVTLPGAPSHARLLTHLAERLHFRGFDVAILTERVEGYKQANALQYIFYEPLLSESDWRAGARAVRFSASTASIVGGFRAWANQTDTILRNTTLMSELKHFKPTVSQFIEGPTRLYHLPPSLSRPLSSHAAYTRRLPFYSYVCAL